MTKEELLELLRGKGMDDGAIEALLEEIIVELKPKGEENKPAADEDADMAKAGELLGVTL